MKPANSRNVPSRERSFSSCAEVSRSELLRRWRLGVGVTFAVLLAAGVATLATRVHPPDCVTLVAVGADYADNLSTAHNVHGWRGLVNLCQYGATAEGRARRPLLHAAAEPIVADDNFEWSEAVELMKSGPAMLVVSLHGSSDENGPYLRRQECSYDDDASKLLRVTDLLAELRKLPAALPKVVVFDATMTAGSWRYGEAENLFAAGLNGLSDDIEAIPGLVVVSSSSEGQQSWLGSGVGATGFLEALLDSVNGAADDSDTNGRISLEEALAATGVRVSENAARLNRSQTLMLLPRGDRGRDRSRRLEVAFAGHRVTPAKSSVAWAPLAEKLRRNWADLTEIRADIPQPEVEATSAWRRYRGLIIRREQLLAIGADEAVQRVSDAVDDAETILMEKAHAASLAADPLNPKLFSAGDAMKSAADAAFAELWQAADSDHHRIAARVLSDLPTTDAAVLRRLLLDRVIDAVSDDPQGRLHKGSKVIDALHHPSTPLPVDAHLVTVLAEGLPEDLSAAPWREALRLALATRRLSNAPLRGEGAGNGYTAELQLWLREKLARADQTRLRGEDLLFTGEGQLPAAIASLRDAKQLYEACLADASAIRNAYETRDTALDLLSGYAEVAESLHATSEAAAAEISKLVDQAVTALELTHELDDELSAVELGDREADAVLSELPAKTASVDVALAAMREDFRRWRTELVKRGGAQLELNRLAALLANDVDISERMRLLALNAALSSDDGDTNDDEQLAEAAWRETQRGRRARLALAIIGRQAYDRSSEGRDVYVKAIKAIESAETDVAAVQVTKACSSIAATWLRNAATASGLTEDVNTDRSKWRHNARSASAVRWLVDSANVWSRPSLLEEVIRINRYNYFIGQAQRALTEAWCDSRSGEGPRYHVLATAYLEAADRIIPGRETTDRLIAAAGQPLSWKLHVPDMVDLVSSASPAFELRAELIDSPIKSTVNGVCAVRIETPGGYRLLEPLSTPRIALPVEAEAHPSGVPVVVGSNGEAAGESPQYRLKMSGWFRGSRLELSVLLRDRFTPSTEFVEAPRRPGAGVSILDTRNGAEIAEGGAVAIVLDASGSMGPGADTSAKYRLATATLESLLRELPTGIQVSVWVFGQAVGDQKTTANPESTITRLVDPVRWSSSDEQLIDKVMARLAYPGVEPWNESPLTRALLMASRDLRNASGFRSVIAITDGVDNRFADDAYANPQRRTVEEVMREELAGSGVSVHVIGFQVAAPEQAEARRQFAFLSQLTPAGKWWEANEAAGLKRLLRAAFEESQTAPLYSDMASTVSAPMGVATISRQRVGSAWPASPVSEGGYDLPRLTSNATPQKALLSDGDLLLLATRQNVNGVYLVPTVYSALYATSQTMIEAAGWRCSILSDRLLPNGARSTLVSLEKTFSDEVAEPLLKVTRPNAVWFEASANPSQPLRWRRVEGYPAPCWEIEWPAGSTAGGLAVWWSDPKAPTMSVAFRRNEERQQLVDCVGQSWRIDGAKVTLRRLVVETQPLPNMNGAIVDQPCLVAELHGAPRCLTRLQGYHTAGQRQQWFAEAQASVATFWPVTAEALGGAVEGVELVSIDSLKQQAESAGRIAVFEEATPTAGDYPPIPVVDWFNGATAPTPANEARRADRRAQ